MKSGRIFKLAQWAAYAVALGVVCFDSSLWAHAFGAQLIFAAGSLFGAWCMARDSQ